MNRIPLILALAFGGAPILVRGQDHGVMPEKHVNVLRTSCFDCHDATSAEGGVNLESLSLRIDSVQSAETWQKVLNVLNSGEMPPQDAEPMGAAEKTELLADLSRQLVIARDALADTGGVITMRRLNRREYKNTIEALLGVTVDVNDLPDDANPGGFDTTGSALYFSSDQFELYLEIARRALDRAMVSGKRPRQRLVRVQAEDLTMPRMRQYVANVAGDYFKKKYPDGVVVRKLDRAEMLEAIQNTPNYRWLNHQAWLQHPATRTGTPLFNLFADFALPDVELPEEGVSYKFVIRVRAAMLHGDVPEHRRYLEYGSAGKQSRRGEMNVHGFHKISATMDQPHIIEFEYTPANRDELKLRIRERHINELNAAKAFFRRASDDTGAGPPPALWIDWVEWKGPIVGAWPSESHKKIFLPRKTGLRDEQYHREILEHFASRAFRTKEPSQTFLDRLMAIYRDDVANGVPVREALKEQMAIVLASPGFLYLNEPTHGPDLHGPDLRGQESHELSNRELAVRLAYFLWSGPPDAELLQAADAGALKQTESLGAQAERMLLDPKADEFVRGFAHQWLHMERLDFFQFNYLKYPRFDDSAKESARREIFETIKEAIQQQRPIGELLTSDHVVINNVLAGYYGIDGVEGEFFRRVAVPAGLPRGGLLGMAAVMAMGSDGERSSPVERGAWMLRCLLNNPPPPAPANVPQLSRLDGEMLPARAMQKAHQEEPQCTQCHRKIDPLGFGLENFNAVGLWRDAEIIQPPVPNLSDKEKKADPRWRKKIPKPKTVPIDASGTMPNGEPFNDFFELREQVAEHEEDFARGFTENLIEYALGRPYGFTDARLADQIMDRAKAKDYAMNEFILGMIESERFRLK